MVEVGYFSKLYQYYMEHTISLTFRVFSFFVGSVDEFSEQLRLLEQADILYVCGFARGLVGMPECLVRVFSYPSLWQIALLDKLRERVQYDQLLYIGVCVWWCCDVWIPVLGRYQMPRLS